MQNAICTDSRRAFLGKLAMAPRTCNQHISRILLHRVPLASEVLTVNPKSPPWEAVTAVLFLIQPT